MSDDFTKAIEAHKIGDYTTTFAELFPLAEAGNADAQTALGFMYANGHGISKNRIRGYMWLNIAAAQGQKDASEGRDMVAKMMTPEQIAEAKKMVTKCLVQNYKSC